ncbi:MAG: hypothetical protein V1771_01270 [Chloroflexota bacterium]
MKKTESLPPVDIIIGYFGVGVKAGMTGNPKPEILNNTKIQISNGQNVLNIGVQVIWICLVLRD